MLERNRPVPQEQPWPAVGPFHVRPERKPARAGFELTETWLQAERPLGLCAALLRYCVNRQRKIVDGHIIKYNLTLFAYLNLRGLWLLRHVAAQSNGPGVANQCSHGPADDPEVLPDSARCHLKIMLAPVIKAGYLELVGRRGSHMNHDLDLNSHSHLRGVLSTKPVAYKCTLYVNSSKLTCVSLRLTISDCTNLSAVRICFCCVSCRSTHIYIIRQIVG